MATLDVVSIATTNKWNREAGYAGTRPHYTLERPVARRNSGKVKTMAQRYTFVSSYTTWDPDGGASRRGRVVIRDANTGTSTSYEMTPGELRQAIRHFARALAFTKEVRRKGQHKTTWNLAVDKRVAPIMELVSALLPKKSKAA